MDKPTRILIVEDDCLILFWLRSILMTEPSFTVVGECVSAEIAIRKIPEVCPDLIIMDIGLPGVDGIECTRQLRLAMPFLPIIIFSFCEEETEVLRAFQAGASGYLTKGLPVSELLRGLQQAMIGGCPLSAQIARYLVKDFRRQHQMKEDLTRRENGILENLARGLLYKEIADHHRISFDTVHYHLKNIYKKLGVRSRSQAVAHYYSARL